MKLQTDCSYIKMTEGLATDIVANPDSYINVKIKATVNCCEEYEQELTSEILDLKRWKVLVVDEPLVNLNSITFENIVTGVQFEILQGVSFNDFTCDDADIEDIYSTIQQWFTDNGLTGVTQSYEIDDENQCYYVIQDLPSIIRPVSFGYIRANEIERVEYFTPYDVPSLWFTNNGVFVGPEFFNLTNFTDGIYNFTIEAETITGDFISESNCFFFDCNTKCKVSTKLEELKKCNKSGTNLFLLHYTLVEGSNCGCNCEALCEIFENLCSELEGAESCVNCGC